MKITDSHMIRFHLRAIHGIAVKSCEKKMKRPFIGSRKMFGVPLENLPRRYIPEFGLVPCFLVDACLCLLERAGTVGLFRKPGSLPRIKTLRAKLNRGEGCLSTALPYDVASLIKQFCRELPEPLFPSELHDALLKAQELPTLQERTSAIQLLSCLLPARNASCLHYLFNFLSKISQRCADNLMTSSNLAVVFTPCLLPPPNKAEMSEDRLELRVLVLRTFIENPHLFVTPSDKTGPWTPVRSKAGTPSVSEQNQASRSSTKQSLRRSKGLENFPSVLPYRIYTDQSFSPETAFRDISSPVNKEACRTPYERFKRKLCAIGGLTKFTRGQDTGSSPVPAGEGRTHQTAWRRRST
ncbi:rho GTPase-activating protein 11B-like isoform X2 [Myripristis murdjan]|uniref:rho GTPase-activating protein 11B-like isoform X2 n=1 Tax=Myripristis murdjan TaxID=586833 RepID=UPI00117626EE|nr:rho GTPase-activating protein 11A isoform X2 [Myripristis murdjan]